MNPLEQDTGPRQLAAYYRLLRQLTPAERLRAVSAATRRMRMMAEAGIRLRQPGVSDETVRHELARLLYGPGVLPSLLPRADR